MQTALETMLKRRRNRSIATILGIMDRECSPDLSPHAKNLLRKVILDQINDLCDIIHDIVESLDTGEVTLNEYYLDRIDQIHQALIGEPIPDRTKEIHEALAETPSG
jgi:hypothetical protein